MAAHTLHLGSPHVTLASIGTSDSLYSLYALERLGMRGILHIFDMFIYLVMLVTFDVLATVGALNIFNTARRTH